jgi:hypothetical protein
VLVSICKHSPNRELPDSHQEACQWTGRIYPNEIMDLAIAAECQVAAITENTATGGSRHSQFGSPQRWLLTKWFDMCEKVTLSHARKPSSVTIQMVTLPTCCSTK